MEQFRLICTQPQAWLLDQGLTTDRLDAGYYEPRFLNDSRELDTSGIPTPRIGKIASKANCGATPKLVEYGASGAVLIRGANIRPNYFDGSSAERVPGLEVPKHSNRAVLPGDLLYTMSGVNVGNVAIYPQGEGVASFSNTVARARFASSSEIDPYFASLFLNSRLGMSQTRRLISGGVLPHVMPNSFKNLRLIVPPLPLQAAIGNKCRKAERLREMANARRQLVEDRVDQWYGTYSIEDGEAFGWLDRRHLSPRRVDAWFNLPKFVRFGEKLAARDDLIPVSALCRLTTTTVDWGKWSTDTFEYFEIGGIDGQPGSITSQSVRVDEAPSRAKFVVGSWDILVSTVRPNLKNIALVPESVKLAVCSSGFSALRAKSHASAGFLWGCLLHDVATAQLLRWNTGGTYPAIERTVPPHVLVPNPGEDAINETGQMVVDSFRWNAESQALVTAAMMDVDALVTGNLDDSTLLQQAEEISNWLSVNPNPNRRGAE